MMYDIQKISHGKKIIIPHLAIPRNFVDEYSKNLLNLRDEFLCGKCERKNNFYP